MATELEQLEKIVGAELAGIREPMGKNLIEAGMVLGLRGLGDGVAIVLKDPGFPEPIRMRIEREVVGKVGAKAPDVKPLTVEWQAGGKPTVDPNTPKIANVIAVGSGKGGVGKSTIAASLAYALKHRGHRVGLMDADVYGPSIPHMLGLSGRPDSRNNLFVPPEMDGIKVISMGFLVSANQAVVWRGPMLHKAVRDFLFQVAWGELDYLVVDLPPGTGDVVLSLSQTMPITGGVIVCTPQDVALLDARKAHNMLQTVKIPCLGVVENMSYFLCPKCSERTEIFGHGGAKRWAEEIGAPFLGSVPLNLQVRLNGDQGHVRNNFLPGSPVRDVLLEIGDRLAAGISANSSPAIPSLEIVG